LPEGRNPRVKNAFLAFILFIEIWKISKQQRDGDNATLILFVSFHKRSYSMATIIRKEERDFQPHPGRMDG